MIPIEKMKISLQNIGKRFQRYMIFRDMDIDLVSPSKYALLGHNGSGKSTLLRIIAGMQAPSQGKMFWYDGNDKLIPIEKLYNYISFCAPGQQLVEELTLSEFFDFHFSFKRPLNGLSVKDIIAITRLPDTTGKTIGDYSSGMKQRVKLAQAIFSDTSILLLDEPCTNLDQQGVEQYRNWIEQYAKDRLVIVASNDTREHFFCTELFDLEEYKKVNSAK